MRELDGPSDLRLGWVAEDFSAVDGEAEVLIGSDENYGLDADDADDEAGAGKPVHLSPLEPRLAVDPASSDLPPGTEPLDKQESAQTDHREINDEHSGDTGGRIDHPRRPGDASLRDTTTAIDDSLDVDLNDHSVSCEQAIDAPASSEQSDLPACVAERRVPIDREDVARAAAPSPAGRRDDSLDPSLLEQPSATQSEGLADSDQPTQEPTGQLPEIEHPSATPVNPLKRLLEQQLAQSPDARQAAADEFMQSRTAILRQLLLSGPVATLVVETPEDRGR